MQDPKIGFRIHIAHDAGAPTHGVDQKLSRSLAASPACLAAAGRTVLGEPEEVAPRRLEKRVDFSHLSLEDLVYLLLGKAGVHVVAIDDESVIEADVETRSFPIGHIGMYVSSRSQKEIAPLVVEWLGQRSKEGAKAPRKKAAKKTAAKKTEKKTTKKVKK